ncbi:MAG: CoA-binding domain protein [Ramlibacter sp.]|nr:CoA-binding domain protein [Ramlibacter sp.]
MTPFDADAADPLASKRRQNLQRLLTPRSIAVVGASADPGKAGSQAMRSLSRFPGKLMAVHPREREIQGFPCYPSLSVLPEPVDLAILAIPAQHCVQAARDAAARGVGGIFIISGGFGESGEAGQALQEQLAEVCRSTGLRLLGPNTSGFVNPHQACVASFVPGVGQLAAGRVAVVAQSGGINLTLSFLLNRLGEGISLAVGLGNAVDVGSADVLSLLGDDPHTAVIALHLEGVPQGRHLFETLKKVTPKKPVVALVAGRSDIGEFAVSHTGNLIGSWERTAAALTQAGVVVVDSTEELAQAAAVLAAGRLRPNERNGFAVVTGQAGPGLLIVDGLKTAGLFVPELAPATIQTIGTLLPPMTYVKNPVDTGRPSPTFPEIVRHVAADPRIDATLVFALSEPSVLDPAKALRPAVALGKPVVFGTLGMAADLEGPLASLRDLGIPAVLSPERLVLAARCLDADARAQWRLARPLSGQAGVVEALSGKFDEARGKELLAQYGIRSPQRKLCVGREQALAAFAGLSKPVVVKIAAADVAHKTEAGGVVLNVRTDADLRQALDAIARIPTATPGRVLLEEMAPAGVELIVGGVRDPSWGPCVVIGLGGVTAEAMADSAVRLAPLGREDVNEMLASLRGKQLLDGFRNLPVCDRGAIAEAAIAIGRALMEHPEIAEIEINPLRMSQDGALALDALVVLRSGS